MSFEIEYLVHDVYDMTSIQPLQNLYGEGPWANVSEHRPNVLIIKEKIK